MMSGGVSGVPVAGEAKYEDSQTCALLCHIANSILLCR